MPKATITTLAQTESNGLSSLTFEAGRLRLYCLRLSDHVLIAGGGGRKTTRTYDENAELSGYVISLQKLDALIRADVRRGNIIIDTAHLADLDNKTFSL